MILIYNKLSSTGILDSDSCNLIVLLIFPFIILTLFPFSQPCHLGPESSIAWASKEESSVRSEYLSEEENSLALDLVDSAL